MSPPDPCRRPGRHSAGALAGALLAVTCGGEPARPPAPSRGETPEGVVFVERATAAGLDFVHFNGMSGEHYPFEHMGAGVALFDYDRDGDLDVYLAQGHMLGPGKTLDDASLPPPDGPLIDRLYRNDLEIGADGSRRLHFTDVTEETGIVADGYGMGVAVGDYDDNGWPDLYVTNWGSPNQLWRNNGDLTFADVTAAAGVGETRWSIAAAFLDFDRDGRLDLFVANYLDATYAVHRKCNNDLGLRDYCGPASYRPVPDVLYRNRGDGTFEPAGSALDADTEPGSGMGVTTGDFDGNGWLDLYVANDELPNHLFMNAGDGTFREAAVPSGAAVNALGTAEAGMGVDAGDIDGDGDEDLFVAHLGEETNTLYANVGGGIFEDRTAESRLGPPSWASTGFGAGYLDYDNDGRLDLFVANGSVQAQRDLLLAGDPHPLHQKNQLYRNLGDGGFVETSGSAGPAFQLAAVSRGAGFGDLDNDGDVDIVVSNNAGRPHLLIIQVGQSRGWLGLVVLTGESPGRDALGAWVEAVLADGTSLGRRVRTEGSYASARDPRVIFGLGDSAEVERLRVQWTDGRLEEWPATATGRYTTLRRGSGTLVAKPADQPR